MSAPTKVSDSIHELAAAAQTTPQLMRALWQLAADASKNMQKGVSYLSIIIISCVLICVYNSLINTNFITKPSNHFTSTTIINSIVQDSATVLFPGMEQKLSNPKFLNKLMGHFDACKDVCDNFGVTTILVPHALAEQRKRILGFTVKSYRNPFASGAYSGSADASDMKFAPDPFWDDDEEWDFSGVDEVDDYNAFGDVVMPEIEDLSPKDDAVVVDISKKWVKKMMSDLALCPFTQSAEKSGIPLGPVHYQVDRVITMEDAYAAYWAEVCRIENVGQDEISTTLQILWQQRRV